MRATTVAIDLAKEIFELAFAEADHQIVQRKRLSRRTFGRVLDNHAPVRVVMEACSSAHYWARRFLRQGHAVRLLPARDARPYVRRNKTDRTEPLGKLAGRTSGANRPMRLCSWLSIGSKALLANIDKWQPLQ